MACIGCLPLWLPCRRKASYCPWQGAWNEVYGGYGAYTKSTAHRRGNSLDDMDIGSIEDTRGQQIEHGARVGMEIAQLTSWSSLNIFHHFSSWSQRGPRFYGWPFWFISFWETWDDLGNPWPWSKAPADPRGRRSDLSQHKAVTIFDVTRWPGRAACGAKSLPCTAWSWCPCWFWCGHTEFSVMLVDVGWCWLLTDTFVLLWHTWSILSHQSRGSFSCRGIDLSDQGQESKGSFGSRGSAWCHPQPSGSYRWLMTSTVSVKELQLTRPARPKGKYLKYLCVFALSQRWGALGASVENIFEWLLLQAQQ